LGKHETPCRLLEELRSEQLQRDREVGLERFAEADEEIVAIDGETFRAIERINNDGRRRRR
jgi:hypothetical protein